MRDLLWLEEHVPDLVETLHAYIQWRREQEKQQQGRKGRRG